MQNRIRTLILIVLGGFGLLMIFVPAFRGRVQLALDTVFPPPDERSERLAAPEFDLDNIAGGTLSSAAVKGKVAVIDIWATWCEPCIREIPAFNDLYQTWSPRGVEVIAITVQSPVDEIPAKVQEFGMTYPVVVGDDAVVEGFGGLQGYPTTFVVSKDWKIYKKYLGALPRKHEQIAKDIEKLLAEKAE